MSKATKIEYLLFMLVAALVPISWRYAVWAVVLLALFVIVRAVVSRPARKKPTLPAIALVLFFVCYAVSMLYTENIAEGWNSLSYKLPFLLLPVVFFLADMSWFNANRRRAVLYVFTYSMALFFLVRLCLATYKFIFVNDTLWQFFSSSMVPVHRGYMAMYVLLSLSFLYTERGQSKPRWLSVSNVVAAVLVTVTLLLTQSRAGMLMLGLLMLAIWIDITFIRKRLIIGASVAVAALLFAAGVLFVLPQDYNRVTSTIQDARDGNVMGARAWTNQAAWGVIKQNPVIGVGVGDRIDQMCLQYDAMGKAAIRDRQLNPHNQYLDTQMTVGILGSAVFLLILAIPLCIAKYRNVMSAALILIVAVSSLLESILERQMGIIFLAFFLLLLTRVESQNHQSQLPQS